MPSKNIVVVTGATGMQGGSVTKFLLQDGTFAVRALTRNPDSAAAKALAAQGVQVVQADYKNSESLLNAFKGAYGVFGVTNYWEPGVGAEGEVAQGKALVDAAKAAGVKHFVWSTLDRSEFKAKHYESKADVDDYLKASGVPRTSLYTSFYFENLVTLAPMGKRHDGTFDFSFPLITDAPLPVYSAEETGAWVLAAFHNPKQWLGQDIRIASEFLSARDMARTMGDAIGKTVHVQEISPEMFETQEGDSVLTDEARAGLRLFFLYNKPPFRDPELTRRLYPGTTSFRAWAEANASTLRA